jgi:hypothetical protein
VGSALALGHAVFYFIIMSRHYEGSWGGFLIYLVDFPASVLVLLLSNALGIRTPYALLAGGTAWWFCIGILITKLLCFSRKEFQGESSKALCRAASMIRLKPDAVPISIGGPSPQNTRLRMTVLK